MEVRENTEKIRKKKKKVPLIELQSQLSVQRELAWPRAQMFGSHSIHEHGVFSPALKTPPHPGTTATLSPEF